MKRATLYFIIAIGAFAFMACGNDTEEVEYDLYIPAPLTQRPSVAAFRIRNLHANGITSISVHLSTDFNSATFQNDLQVADIIDIRTYLIAIFQTAGGELKMRIAFNQNYRTLNIPPTIRDALSISEQHQGIISELQSLGLHITFNESN